MVSNSLNMDLQEMLKVVERLHRDYGATEDYQQYRRDLPKEWPL